MLFLTLPSRVLGIAGPTCKRQGPGQPERMVSFTDQETLHCTVVKFLDVAMSRSVKRSV